MSQVFEPMMLGGLTLHNRVARSATNDYMGHEDGSVSAQQLALYDALAAGGVGLIFTGHIGVSPRGRNDIHQNALWDDCFIEGLRRMADVAHAHDAKIVAQLSHAGAKAQTAAIKGEQPVAPSAMTLAPGANARPLTGEEIAQIERDFAQAARRAQQAGFDGVQIHCAHGYLLSQFLDPAWNTREDAYGGSPAARFRIVEETIRQVRDAVGDAYPIFVKLHCNDVGNTPEYAHAFEDMLCALHRIGIAAAEVSGCDFSARKPDERLYYLDRAARGGQKSGLPIILVGGVRTLAEMERALDAGLSMVAMSRPFICQPDVLQRLQAGESALCIGCFGCFTCYQKTGRRCVLHR